VPLEESFHPYNCQTASWCLTTARKQPTRRKVFAQTLLILVARTILSGAVVAAAQGDKPLTCADVILISKACMSQETILKAIEVKGVTCDPTPEALLKLKDGGVTQAVIQAMLKATARPMPPSPPIPSQPLATPAIRQDGKPDFSGRWEVDKSKSTVNVVSGAAPVFDSMTMLIEHKAHTMKIIATQMTGLTETTVISHYVTDGSETTNTYANGIQARSRCRWNEQKLIFGSLLTLQLGKGRSLSGSARGSWLLSGDGNTLTVEEYSRLGKQVIQSTLRMIRYRCEEAASAEMQPGLSLLPGRGKGLRAS
jgi:hypothetical protein